MQLFIEHDAQGNIESMGLSGLDNAGRQMSLQARRGFILSVVKAEDFTAMNLTERIERLAHIKEHFRVHVTSSGSTLVDRRSKPGAASRPKK